MVASMENAYGHAFSATFGISGTGDAGKTGFDGRSGSAISTGAGLGGAGTTDDFADQAVRGATDKITNPYQAKLAALSGHQDEVDPTELKALKHAGIIECATCAGRKYQDGSDEENVSFKTPGHVDPSQSAPGTIELE
jgi:hypothetical protein